MDQNEETMERNKVNDDRLAKIAKSGKPNGLRRIKRH